MNITRRATATATAGDYLPDITQLVGGGPTALDGCPTAGVAHPRLWKISIGDTFAVFKLRDEAEGEARIGATLIRPTDYDALTNKVILARIA